jgi:hypothetical protein
LKIKGGGSWSSFGFWYSHHVPNVNSQHVPNVFLKMFPIASHFYHIIFCPTLLNFHNHLKLGLRGNISILLFGKCAMFQNFFAIGQSKWLDATKKNLAYTLPTN